MPNRPAIAPADRKRMRLIAALLDGEARTYLDGFSVLRDDGKREWDANADFASVRHFRLEAGARFLRGLADRADRREQRGGPVDQPFNDPATAPSTPATSAPS